MSELDIVCPGDFEMAQDSSPRPATGSTLLVAVLLAAGMVSGWHLWTEFNPWRLGGAGLDVNAKPRPIEARGKLSEIEQANIEIYQRCAPSLVQVTSLAVRGEGFGLDVQEVPKGAGSGFVWDDDGHIVTNFHVVEGADALQVTLADHTTLEVRHVWPYPDRDIAVLSVDVSRTKLRPITVGTSHDLKVGQIVYALGDPFGLDQTMTDGIVSALGREIKSTTGRPISGVIQTSAAINPGNSGGPLLDSAGRLIGMNTSILSPSGTFAGIGFAIPVDEINRIVPQLIAHGKIVRPWLGVQLAEDQLARHLGIVDGALILKVAPGSPAAKAGLRETTRDRNGKIHLGDVLLALDKHPIRNSKELGQVLDEYRSGTEVSATIERDGERSQLPVTLAAAQ